MEKISKKEVERRKKISESLKKTLSTPEMQAQRSKTATGRKHSEKTKQKISLLRSGNGNGMFGKPLSEDHKNKISHKLQGHTVNTDTKQKISKAHTGKVIPYEQRDKISASLKKYYKLHPNPFAGKNHSEESKQKMKIANTGKFRGENGPNWQGGVDSFPYSKEWTLWLINIIKERDNFTCQNPKCLNPHKTLDVHHIDYNKMNCDKNNLITLCKRCHGKTQKNRKYWISYYQNLRQCPRWDRV